MSIYPEILIAYRYMRSKQKEGFASVITIFSVIGITLGVATLILVTSLMNGVRNEMLINLIGIDGHIFVRSRSGSISNPDELIKSISQIEGVKSVTKRIQGQVMLSSKYNALGAQVIAVDNKGLQTRDIITKNITNGNIENFSNGIILGEYLANSLGVRVNDTISMISPKGRSTFVGFIPRIKEYRVIATVKTGVNMLDKSLVVMPINKAAIYFNMRKYRKDTDISSASAEYNITGIDIFIDDKALRTSTEEIIKQIKRSEIFSEHSEYTVYDYKKSNEYIMTALNIQRDVMVVILAMIILVAAFNIVSSLIMLVQDKRADIAILRTIGASKSMILRIFIIAGTSIGIVGTMAGVILGIFAADNIENIRKILENITGQELLIGEIYFLSTLPTKTNIIEVATIALSAIFLSFVSTLYPAFKAARQNPVTGLRK